MPESESFDPEKTPKNGAERSRAERVSRDGLHECFQRTTDVADWKQFRMVYRAIMLL